MQNTCLLPKRDLACCLLFQMIAELKTAVSLLTEENSRQQLAAEQRLQELGQKFEDKKQQLITDNNRAIKVIWGFQSLMLLAVGA